MNLHLPILLPILQMDATQHKVKSEMDRKFEEDLERARALSLESLALEKFKYCKQQRELEKLHESQKQRLENAISSDTSKQPDIYARKMSAPQTSNNNNTQERLELKSRPRPGSFNSGKFSVCIFNSGVFLWLD